MVWPRNLHPKHKKKIAMVTCALLWYSLVVIPYSQFPNVLGWVIPGMETAGPLGRLSFWAGWICILTTYWMYHNDI